VSTETVASTHVTNIVQNPRMASAVTAMAVKRLFARWIISAGSAAVEGAESRFRDTGV